MDSKIVQLTQIVNDSSNIVFFGGAGVSTESNIPDFRSSDGLYSKKYKVLYSPEEILSHTFFMNHTDKFYEFYKKNMIFKDANPNLAHKTLAKLEDTGKLEVVITQNIDGLHQIAGNKNVLELHGSIHRNYCTNCGTFFSLDYILNSKTNIPYCDKCNSIIKPDVVLYEEALDENIMYRSIKYIENADTLIVGGTSLVVYPAAGIIRYFRGENLILINKTSTPYDNVASLVINDSIGKVLSYCID